MAVLRIEPKTTWMLSTRSPTDLFTPAPPSFALKWLQTLGSVALPGPGFHIQKIRIGLGSLMHAFIYKNLGFCSTAWVSGMSPSLESFKVSKQPDICWLDYVSLLTYTIGINNIYSGKLVYSPSLCLLAIPYRMLRSWHEQCRQC